MKPLSAKEAADEGLPSVLSPDEAAAEGLLVEPTPPAGKVPSPTGWVDPAKTGGLGDLNKLQRDKERENANMWGALASGAHGAASAMEGPVNGAIAALKKSMPSPGDKAPPSWDDIKAAYYARKNSIEGDQKQNLKDFPHAPIVGALMAGGVGSAPTAATRVGLSGLQGGVYGFGSSPHDLDGPNADPAGAIKDADTGAELGLGAGVAGEALNAGASALGKKLGSVLDKNQATVQAARDKAMRAGISAHGGDVSAGSNQLKMLREALTNPNADPELAKRAEEFLASEEGKALLNRVLSSNIGRAEGQVGRIANSQKAMLDAIDAASPEAVQAGAAARLNDPSALTRRVRELAPKVILPALGGALGGPAGAAVGGLVGVGMGRSATTLKNAITDPYVSSRLLGTGVNAFHGAGNAMSHAAPPLAEWSRFLKKDEDHGDE